MKVGIYCRISTDKQELKNQMELCKTYCFNKGWTIYRVYEDIISGTTESRPAFNQLLEDMRRFKFRAIVVTKLDRMGRSLKHLLSLFEEFKDKSVEVIAITQNIDTTSSAGKLQMQIIGAFAEFERNMISERTKEGLRYAKNVGKRGKDKKPRQKRGGLRKSQSYE